MLKPPVQPMLLKTIKKPFNSPEYLFEFKWDGFRSIIFVNNSNIYIQSRNKKNLTPYFPELKNIQNTIKKNSVIFDGEICYFNKKNNSVFEILQKRLNGKNSKLKNKFPVTFFSWDILTLDDQNLYTLPLLKRKKILNEIIKEKSPFIQVSPYIMQKGINLFNIARKNNFEGIVAKKIDSVYEFKRSEKWLKIKNWNFTDIYIGGYTKNKTALITGQYINNKEFKYRGKVKLSLKKHEKKALFNFLPQLIIKKSPFKNKTGLKKTIWVKPLIKCKVKYTEMTQKKLFRHGYAVKLIIE